MIDRFREWWRAWVWHTLKWRVYGFELRREVCRLRGHRWFYTGTACLQHGVTEDTDRHCLRCVRHEALSDCCAGRTA